VVNAGDGRHAHSDARPCWTCTPSRHYKKDFSNLTVGDCRRYSPLARGAFRRSMPLTTLGVPEVRVIAPKTLLPTGVERLGVRVFNDMQEGLRGVDVVMMLRLPERAHEWRPAAQPAGVLQVLRPDAGETGASQT